MSDYSHIKSGDVILTAGTNPWIKIGNCLRGRLDGLKWTHAAISLGADQLVEAVETGIRQISLHDQYVLREVDHMILRCKELSEVERTEVATYCKQRHGKPYDSKALAYFALNGLFPIFLGPLLCLSPVENWLNVKESYFCSELVSEGFMNKGFFIAKTDPYKIMPVDFLNKKRFEVITHTTF